MEALMVKATMRRGPGGRSPLIGQLQSRVNHFLDEDKKARKEAATRATARSKSVLAHRPNARPQVPHRAGRWGGQGQLLRFVKWEVTSTGAEVNWRVLDKKAPHWIIMEVGTGPDAESVRLKRPPPGKTGRPKKTDRSVRHVPSQVGRPISGALEWTNPGQASGGQLMLVGKMGLRQATKLMFITREIEGAHYIKAGAKIGYRQYRQDVLAAAQKAFARRRSG